MPRRNQRLRWIAIVIYILFLVYRVNANGGGLTLYIKRRFANSHLNLQADNDLFLVKEGKLRVHAKKWLKKFTLPYGANSVEMTWVTRKYNVDYSLLVSSSNPEILRKPKISPIPTEGYVPKKAQTFRISVQCTGSTRGNADAKFVLNYTKREQSGDPVRSSTNKLEFAITVHCNKSTEVNRNTKTPTKKTLNRVVVVTISAVVACVVCLLVAVIFFWRFIKRIRKKFGFDEITERFSPLTDVSCQSTTVSLSSSPLPTVVYSPKRDRSPNTFFTTIAKHEDESEECLTQPTSEQTSRFCIQHGDHSVRGTFSSGGTFFRQSSQDLKRFNQGSVGDDDVFVSERADVALIQNEQTPSVASSLPARVKDTENKKEMYSTMNEYWSMKLGDSLKLRSDVDIQLEIIGEGAFGRVHRGKLTHEDTIIDVAVKVCQDDIEFEQMVSYVNEAILMKSLDHENVLNLLGVVLQPISPPLILTPLMAHGDLHKFLRHSRGIGIRRQLIGSRQLVNFATQIARGMEYLTKQKVVHRDLAARNCFVDKDLNIKVGDLGLAKDVHQIGLYKIETPGQLAVKWLALESLLYYIFTEKTDVWSFGIVLWELVTLGSQPYAGLDNYEVAPYLEAGKRLSRPLRCPDDLFAIMYSCWLASPEDRPSFTILVHKLGDYEQRLRPSCIAFEFDEDTIEMTDDCESHQV